MANTYHQQYAQTVFAVKYRDAVIGKAWRKMLHGVIGNLINETGCKTIIVNGVEDHVHCFFSFKPRHSISDIMKSAKAKSSKWVNESGLLNHRFEWQEGFGSFTYHHAQIDNVYKYIQRQEAHHHVQLFRDEYVEMLINAGVEYDEKYIFENLL